MDETHHTVAVQHVRGVLQGAIHAGADVDRLLSRAGITPALLDADLARVSLGQYSALIRVLRRTLRDELWGLLGRPVPIGAFGVCLGRLVACPDLQAALREAILFWHLLADDVRPRLVVREGVATLRFDRPADRGPRLDYGVKALMLFTHGAASWLVGRRVPLRRVDYVDPAPTSETARVYRAPVRYGQPRFALAFDARWLGQPVVQTPASLRRMLRVAPAPLLVGYRDPRDLGQRVRLLLRGRLGGPLPTIDELAASLRMTPQTLRRRLGDEAGGYRRLKDALRRDVAIELLTRTPLSASAISARLGFSEASTFHRAFKGWTGVAPGAYRTAAHRRDAVRRGAPAGDRAILPIDAGDPAIGGPARRP